MSNPPISTDGSLFAGFVDDTRSATMVAAYLTPVSFGLDTQVGFAMMCMSHHRQSLVYICL